MVNPTLNLRLRWADESADPTVSIKAYRLAYVVMGREEDADINLIAGVKRFVEWSCGRQVSDDEARKILDEGLVTLHIAGI